MDSLEILAESLQQHLPLPQLLDLQTKIEKTFWADSLLVRIGDTTLFSIEIEAFSGYRIKYKDVFLDSEVSVELYDRSDVLVDVVIKTILLGEIERIKLDIKEVEKDWEKITTKEDIQQLYSDNESSNLHDSNVFLLALKFGNKDDVKRMKQIMIVNRLAGYGLKDGYDIHERLYPKLEKPEAE